MSPSVAAVPGKVSTTASTRGATEISSSTLTTRSTSSTGFPCRLLPMTTAPSA